MDADRKQEKVELNETAISAPVTGIGDKQPRSREDAELATSAAACVVNYCLGSKEIERLVCGDDPVGSLDNVQRRGIESWRLTFSSLRSLKAPSAPRRSIHVCIATEEIVGPVRNGGIGTTYAFLAEMLGSQGFIVTILYLKGQEVENGTIDQWIEYYAQKGAKFVPVPNYAALDRLQTGADRWLQAPYNMMRYLLDHPMDVVHVSEWRGSGYLSLLAKHQGLAFRQTLFIVKTSSPWLWNRLYGSQPIDRAEDLTKIYAERKSVELADIVVGGSSHLLRWMSSQGYQLPHSRTFVQPNVVFFDHLKEIIGKRSNQPGSKVPIDEIVFFGRLEARKGLFLFCEAIDRMVNLGTRLPPVISFMGKPGARLTARPDQDILDYINEATARWPCKVMLHTEFQQVEALQYLLGASRLAVMPSIIENSSLAVYEATMCGIPFIASSSGGTPELVAVQDRKMVLCDAHPLPLAEKIGLALRDGGYIASPSFDNDENLNEWRAFHDALGCGLLEDLLLNSVNFSASAKTADISICIYHGKASEALEVTLQSLAEQVAKPCKVVVGLDCAPEQRAQILATKFTPELDVAYIDCYNYDAGLSFNALAETVRSEYILFLWSGSRLRPEALQALQRTAIASGADVINFFCRVVDSDDAHSSYLSAPILGSVTEAFFRTDLSPMPVLATHAAFKLIGGFTTDYRVLGCEQEFVARCQVQGLLCTTALMEMGSVEAWSPGWIKEKCYDEAVSQFRMVRPQIAAAPLALRDMMLFSKGLQARSGKKPLPRRVAPKPGAEKRSNSAFAQLFALMNVADGSDLDIPSPKANAFDRPSQQVASNSIKSAIDRKENKYVELMRQQLHRLPGSEHITGRLLGVRGNSLFGWVRNEIEPQHAVTLDCLCNGRRFATISANHDLCTAIALPRDLQNHCFRVDLPNAFIRRGIFRRPAEVTIKVAGQAVVLAVTKVGFKDLALAGYDGHCEVVRPGIVHGWAWKPNEPENNVDVALFIDNLFLTRVPCTRNRDDLKIAGVGYGNYGFEVIMPKQFRDGQLRVIDVVIADVGIPLKSGRLALRGDVIQKL